jgi:hypothetical protein
MRDECHQNCAQLQSRGAKCACVCSAIEQFLDMSNIINVECVEQLSYQSESVRGIVVAETHLAG